MFLGAEKSRPENLNISEMECWAFSMHTRAHMHVHTHTQTYMWVENSYFKYPEWVTNDTRK